MGTRGPQRQQDSDNGMVKIIARVEAEQKRRLYHILLDEGRSFSEWMRDAMDSYIEQREGKPPKRGR